MNAQEWIAAYAGRLDTEPPTADEFKALLDLAGEAAHGGSLRVTASAVAKPRPARAGAEVARRA